VRRISIVLDDEIAAWATARAAERKTSVSKLIGELLRSRMHDERGYGEAGNLFFSIAPRPLAAPGTAYPRRDELHERSSRR
jgi:hypothetical protein